MNSKTFKSAVSAGHLNIHDSKRGLITVSISRDKAILEMIDLKTETAPAIALAILEAAGVEARSIPSARLGTSEHLSDTAYELSTYIEKQQRATAEAKEQAELEAEAFELRRAYLEGRARFDSWNELTDAERDHWLAVARRAREMAKEATK